MPIHQVLRLARGAITELDSSEEDKVPISPTTCRWRRGSVVISGNRMRSTDAA
jgi:hypothetical protein